MCHPQSDDPSGFTLIQLLVVVLIIGILAAIALPVLMDQRDRAYLDAVVADVRNAAIVLEDTYVATLSYPPAGASVLGFTPSKGVHVVVEYSTPEGYCVEAHHVALDGDGNGQPDKYSFDTRVLANVAAVGRGACQATP